MSQKFDRLSELRRHIDKTKLGLEIAPYFNPIAAKSDGYNIRVVDVFDTDTLRSTAARDPNIPSHGIPRIEPVDIVSDASRLGDIIESMGLSGMFDYIVSSHNFEHLPDPIRFLNGCERALAPGGVLSMAIPDYRACFDHFRMPTRLSDWLRAYHEGRAQPAPETLFDAGSVTAFYSCQAAITAGLTLPEDTPEGFVPAQNLRAAYDRYLKDIAAQDSYRDTHCTQVFPASFELILRDLIHLGLTSFEIEAMRPTVGIEFFVHLRKPRADISRESDAEFYARRQKLLRAVDLGLGALPSTLSPEATSAWKARMRQIAGDRLSAKLRALNAARLRRRRAKGR